jgi:uncharacterized membrane protein (UPF0127 family)
MKVFKDNMRPVVIFSLLVFFLFLNIQGCRKQEPNDIQTNPPQFYNEPQFTKEGELIFFSKMKEKIITIDVEIPNTKEGMIKGLMYRKTMANTQGMLFVHDKIKTHFFWMKNTFIPLDMIFIDKGLQIVGIEKNTTPLSEKLIPIPKETQFTVEVNAGFCDQYGVDLGDKIVIKSQESHIM